MYGGGQSGGYIFIIIVAVVLLRLLRSRGAHPVNPVLLLIMTLVVLYGSYELINYSGALTAESTAAAGGGRPALHPGVDPSALPFYAIGGLLGLALGVARGRTITFYRDPSTGQVMQKAAAIALLIWLVLFALRFGVRYLAEQGLVGAWATPASDILLLVGTGSIIGRNLYVLFRYVQLSASARPSLNR